MDRVGGFHAYRELEGDARAFEDVAIAVLGESDAARMAALKRKMGNR